jgi:hypothetical protein
MNKIFLRTVLIRFYKELQEAGKSAAYAMRH